MNSRFISGPFLVFAITLSPAFAGDPAPGIDVALEQIPGGNIVAKTNTDSDGDYSFSNVAPGNYKLTFTKAVDPAPQAGGRLGAIARSPKRVKQADLARRPPDGAPPASPASAQAHFSLCRASRVH